MGRKGKCGSWKPVQLTENLISKGVEGLVGIEELTDYKLVKDYGAKSIRKQTPGKHVNALTSDGDIQRRSTKRKKDFGQPSSKRRKVNCRRKQQIRTVLEKPKEVPEVNKDETESSDTDDAERKSMSSELLESKMSAWHGVGIMSPILRALEEQGFVEPTEIQAKTLPAAVLGRRDILGAAETGSGKTLAFGIPILHRILEDRGQSAVHAKRTIEAEPCQSENEYEEHEDENSREMVGLGCVQVMKDVSPHNTPGCSQSKLYALVLTPTRELAMQVHKHLTAAARYTGIKIAVVVGGMAPQKQERLLSRGPEIVVATPGRLWELIQDGNPHLAQVSNIRCLAIDETDRMLERGHFQELHNLLELLNVDEGKKRQRQNFVFSATLTMVHEPPRRLKSRNKKLRLTPGQKLQNIMTMLGVTNPKVVDVTKESGTAGTLTEARIVCALEEKDVYLYYFIQQHPGRTLIFCNSISCVRRLAQLLSLLQCRPLPLHANMMQRQRLKNLDRFRDNSRGLLLATDVAARGLDIPGVQHVIHYQVPRTSETYVHRSGRTARAQKEGLTLLLIEPTEVPHYTRLCRTLGRTKDLPLFPISSSLLAAAKQRVTLAQELDRLELATRKSSTETGWFRKALTEMDMLVDDEDLPRQMDDDESNKLRRLASVKRKQLGALLCSHRQHGDMSNAVNVAKSAVDIRAKPQKNRHNLFLKNRRKNKE
ncbi:hypothetical protein B7P43_G01468 [Cryptotermes secundus]|uniref:ATP-dependent RNA helicase n=2 Tax=Cryptotermes secundus TaxID=105785 RepID=A0A2J7RKB6_9NEOP|nr:ATP-dependent RNA helicase DDX24 isoform X2 [Cryptotermes secundus]PNF41284.1 hypothetical protein B7P43_G01468 [Cryptotermes secundus]